MLESNEKNKLISGNKIAIICPYYGKLPNNFKYTFATMSKNTFIDWYIVTDDIFDDTLYNNIYCIKSSFEEIKRKIYLEFNCKIKHVYKLCDYKPLYGILFKDLLEEYEFWGYSDLDIIYGDLTKCLTIDNLNNYDKILELGHFSVYKNEKDINSIYKRLCDNGYDLKSILENDKIYVLDESYGNGHISVNELLEQNGYSVLRKINGCEDIISRFRNIYFVGKGKRKHTYLKYEKGKLYIKQFNKEENQEIIYAHFQKRKILNVSYNNFNNFALTPKGFKSESNIQKKDFFLPMFNFRVLWYFNFRYKRWRDNRKVNWKN